MYEKKLLIVLGVYKPDGFLSELLDSLSTQTFKNFDILITDDSEEKSLNLKEIKDRFIKYKINVFYRSGPRDGFAKNFIYGLKVLKKSYEYYAFCDQDDIWFKEKIEKSLNKLESLNSGNFRLYCSRTEIIDSKGKHIGYSPKFIKPPSFKNSLVQSLAGGNTMVFCEKLRNIIVRSTANEKEISSHDWIAYICATACGGQVIYDVNAHIGYRQHKKNLVGSNTSVSARIKRINMLFKGRLKRWNNQNQKIIQNIFENLTSDNKNTFVEFKCLKNEPDLVKRIKRFLSMGLYRQTFSGNIGMFLAIVFNKF